MVNLELDTSEKVKLIQGEEFIVRKVTQLQAEMTDPIIDLSSRFWVKPSVSLK